MKTLFILLLSSLSAFAMTTAQKLSYAHLYADNLLTQFDMELDQKIALNEQGSQFQSETYQKLLATRMYIEKEVGHDHSREVKSNILLAHNSSMLGSVISEIEKSLNIRTVDSNESDLLIYPTTGSDGNLTGNTFPENVWSLTFDDGPHGSRTQRVLDNLHETNMRATFFVLMEKANKYKDLIQKVSDEGHELALHSYTHPNLIKSTSNLDYEITTAKKELEELSGKNIEVFRLPYGSGMRSTRVRKVIAANEMIHIFWNIDTLDWKDKDPESILARTKKQMLLTPNKSGIILFHDIHNQSVIASRLVMDYLNAENKTVCTLGEIINFFNSKSQRCIK
jgi:peptidoglycan/xylan/chitin deacetylase (PgdA/CDA1 family)